MEARDRVHVGERQEGVRFGLPKKARLLKRGDFLNVQRRGERWTQSGLVFFFRRNHLGLTRGGVTVSKKVGNAVVRNRIKRRVRESYRRLRPDLPAGFDLVVMARPEAHHITYQEIYQAMAQLSLRLKQRARKARTKSPQAPAGRSPRG